LTLTLGRELTPAPPGRRTRPARAPPPPAGEASELSQQHSPLDLARAHQQQMLGRQVRVPGERSLPFSRTPPLHDIRSEEIRSDAPPRPTPARARRGPERLSNVTDLDALAPVAASQLRSPRQHSA
jgi:hypothetical protein